MDKGVALGTIIEAARSFADSLETKANDTKKQSGCLESSIGDFLQDQADIIRLACAELDTE